MRGNGCKGIHGHGKWFTLGGSLLRPQNLAIHKEFSVDEDVGEEWAEMLYVVECHLPLAYSVECHLPIQ